MTTSFKGSRLYLDTHVIDYLYDHAQDYWEGTDKLPTISTLAEVDHSEHIDDLVALSLILKLAFWNELTIVIGNEVIREIGRIPDRKKQRRTALMTYAENIIHFYSYIQAETDADEECSSGVPKPTYYTTFLSQVLAQLNEKDRPLFVEAIEKKCTYFVTTDKQVASLGELSALAGLEIATPVKFIEIIGHLYPEAFDLSSIGLVPDVAFYTWLIPDE